jgi:Flp pilus assembly protein TadD
MSEASLAYGEAAAREPGSFWPPYDRGEFELRRGDPKSALKSLSRAVELNPISPFIYAAIGRAHRQLGDLAQARAAFTRARALSAGNPDVARSIEKLQGEN